MLYSNSISSKVIVMGKNNDIDCPSVVHHLSNDCESASTPHMETPASERTKEYKGIKRLSFVTTPSACSSSSVSTKLASDKDTSSPFWHDLSMKDCPTIETITTAIDIVAKEPFVVSSHYPKLDCDRDNGLEALISSSNRCDDDDADSGPGTSVATTEPMNTMLSANRIISSPRSALTADLNILNENLSCADENDDSEVFADVIYAPESHHDSNRGRSRSIRFSDEKEGTNLATIHLIPWTEDDDANWLPRLEKCRMEL